MKKILLSSFSLFIGLFSFSQVPVLFYDFENNTTRNTFENAVEQGVNKGNTGFTATGVTNFGNFQGAGTFYSGLNDGQAIGANGWTRNGVDLGVNADKYFQFSFNSSGISGLSLEFDSKKSLNNAPNKLGVIWSKDGVNFFTATTSDNVTSDKWKTFAFSFGAEADNQSNIIVRLYGYEAGNASPFLYIDNVTLKATSISGVKSLLDYTAYATSLASGRKYKVNFTNLAISGAGTIVTLNSPLPYNGTLNVGDGATLSVGPLGAMSDTIGVTSTDLKMSGGILTLQDGSTLQLSSTDNKSALKATLGISLLKLNPNATIEFIGSAPQYQDAETLANVIVNNTNGLVQSSDVVINGNLTLKSGIMNPGANKLSIKGNISKTNGAIDASNSEIVFNGTTEQSIAAGAFAGPVKRINVDNLGGVAINSDVIVSEALNLTNGKLNIGTKKLTINGSLVRDGSTETGSIEAADGSLEFNGAIAQNVPGGAFANNKVKNLRISNTHADGVTLNGELDVTSVLDFGAVNNSKLKTNDKLTLKSDANGTARVADLTNNGLNWGNDIIGNVTVERYNPSWSTRKYRLITSPVMNTTINAAWQEGSKWNGSSVNASSGYGTLITGQAQGTAANANNNGFDFWSATANTSASVRYYAAGANYTQSTWQAVTSTLTPNAFDNNEAYLLFIRGDRSVSTGTNAGSTTLRAKGALKKGNFSVNVPATKSHTLVGNPYPSPLDFKLIYDANSTKIQPWFWVWQAALGTGTGGYVLVRPVSPGSSLYEAIPGNGTKSAENRLIHSGEGFFLIPTSSAIGNNTVTIQETHKSSGTPSVSVFREKNIEAPKFYVNVSTIVNGKPVLLDGVMAQFDATSELSEISKAANSAENLSILKGTRDVIVATSGLPTERDTLKLRLWNTTARTYQLEFQSANFASISNGIAPVLIDRYTKSETSLSLNDITSYTFNVNGDAVSRSIDRFMIVYKQVAILPLSITNIKAEVNHSRQVTVQWQAANETGIKSYVVERSTDGNNFNKLTTIQAKSGVGDQSYDFLDTQAFTLNYYRIKIIGTSGEVKYSSIVKAQLPNSSESVNLYPNPVNGKSFNLQMLNKKRGNYTITLYNLSGQIIMTKIIQHGGGSITEVISLQETVVPGNYKLGIKDQAGTNEFLAISILR